MVLAVGDSIPDVKIKYNHPPVDISVTERFKGKNVILVGLPGAFTPC